MYIHIEFHQIPLTGYLVMAPDERDGRANGRNDGRTEGRLDIEKIISIRLRRGITYKKKKGGKETKIKV